MDSKVFWIGIAMKEWKARQEIYHRLNPETPDMYGPDDIEIVENISPDVIAMLVSAYMGGYVPEKVIYPAKSYFVALVYARLLRDHFREDPLAVLDDPDLLHGNDPYFIRYSEAPYVYDTIIGKFGWDFDISVGEIPDVAAYFEDEFQIVSK